MTLWLVRSGKHGEGENYALTNSVVGIGFAEFGDLSRPAPLTTSDSGSRSAALTPSHPQLLTGLVRWMPSSTASRRATWSPYRSRVRRLLPLAVLPVDTALSLMRRTR